jgi:GR25 family glycosyltransferase involved in LPS biosynthesis
VEKIYNYFDAAYIINLDEAKDRFIQVLSRLERQNIFAERFPAIHWKELDVRPTLQAGHAACAASHLALYKKIKAEGHEATLVFEDDVVLRDDTSEIMSRVVSELRNVEWDMAFIGCLPWHLGEQVTPNLRRVLKSCHSHAYAVHEGAIDRLINWASSEKWHWRGFFDLYEDNSLKKLLVMPPLAMQTPGFSFIAGKNTNHYQEEFRFEEFSRKDFEDNCFEMKHWR